MKRAVAVLTASLLWLVVLPFQGPAQTTKDGNALFKEALKLEKSARSAAGETKAVRKLEDALAAFEKSGDMNGQHMALSRLATLFESKGDLEQAYRCLERSLEIADRMKDRALSLQIVSKLAAVSRKLPISSSTIQVLQSLAARQGETGDIKGQAKTCLESGNLLKDSGHLPEAALQFRKAFDIGQHIKEPVIQSDALNGLGTISILGGRFPEAIVYLEKAVPVAEKHGEAGQLELIFINLGYAFKATGKYSESAACFEKALNLVRETKNQVTESLLLTYLGELYGTWGQSSRARKFYEEALGVAAGMGNKKAEARNLIRIAKCLEVRGERDQASEKLHRAVEIYRGEGGIPNDDQEQIGSLYLDLGPLDAAEPFVLSTGSPALMGRLHLTRKNYDKAREQYETLLDSAKESDVTDDLFTAHAGLGAICEASGDFNGAQRHYTAAMEVTEGLRASLLPSARSGFFAVRVNGFDRVTPIKGLVRILMKQGRWAESISPSELARARAFADRLALGSERGYSGVPKGIQDQEHDAVATLAALRQLRNCCPKRENPKRYETLTREIEKADQHLDEVVEMLWRDYPHYAAVKYPRPIKVDELTLRADAYLVMFDALGEGIGIKLLKGKEVIAADYKELGAGEIERAVVAFRRPFETVDLAGFDPELGRRLYADLMAKVLQHVPRGAPLIIIPDDILAELPFECLVIEGNVRWIDGKWGRVPAGLTYLGDVHPIRYFPSLTALALSSHAEKETINPIDAILVIADPVFESTDARTGDLPAEVGGEADRVVTIDLMSVIEDETDGKLRFPRLPQTGKLAQDLAGLCGETCTVYSGLQADKKVFFSEVVPTIDRFSHVVFATHGVYSHTIPGMSEPVLAMTIVPAGTDGLLRMTEVMSMKLNADLVALTACQTGLGQQISGEGVASMGRAFQFAGARAVLMSLWGVDESASIMLVKSVFRNLIEGKGKQEALREARSELRRAGYDHPFFWAAFILVGSGS